MQKEIVVKVSLIAVLLLAIAVMAVMAGQAEAVEAAPVALAAGDEVPPESCATCHGDAGAKHQASYDELYQDGVIQVTDLAYAFTAPGTSTVTFQMTKEGAPFDGTKASALSIYFVPYAEGKFQFEPAAERFSLMGTVAYDGAGGITSTVEESPDFSAVDGLVVVYGRDEDLGRLPARVYQTKYPFAAVLETGAGVDYVSPANDAGCVKCHTDPYLKHGYIYAQVNQDPATDFYTCKACHLDNNEGEHVEWQLLVSDPPLAAAFLAGEAELTPEQAEQYAYNPSLMNDVHMSHAMEFPYPQSMANCVTCHEGKLDAVLADANFRGAVCKSCHPVNAVEGLETPAPALQTIIPERIHEDMDLATEDCTACHAEGEDGGTFREIHSGYNKVIFTADGLKYSDAISVTIDSAAFEGSTLTVGFSAAESPDLEGLDVADIVPTVMVGLYGYDTKDFIIGAHERLFDDNADGKIDGDDQRALEYGVGEEHPRFTTVKAEGGAWEVTADLSSWTDLIAAGTVKRVEIGVMPELAVEEEVTLAINATSRTFDLVANAFADDFYPPIAKVTDGCNSCHEALGTTFHSPSYGGSIVVCRMCHITKSGGSHLEMQSRALDSIIHAIHAFQAFDIGDIDFADPVQAMHYEHHINFPYPTHGTTNCASCHYEGTNDVPDQSKSLPGLLSPSDPITGWDRRIGEVPAYITGPAATACGGCHRAWLIKEDDVNGLISFYQHTKQGGYLIPAGETPADTLNMVISAIMAMFK